MELTVYLQGPYAREAQCTFEDGMYRFMIEAQSNGSQTQTVTIEQGKTYTFNCTASLADAVLFGVRGTGCTVSNVTDDTFDVVFNTTVRASLYIPMWRLTTIVGKWSFNSTIYQFQGVGTYQIPVAFRSNGGSFTALSFTNTEDVYSMMYYTTPYPRNVYSSTIGFVEDAFRSIDFGATPQQVPTNLEQWLRTNATRLTYSISYSAQNGGVSLSGGTAHYPDDTVTVTTSPDFGYATVSVTGTYDDNGVAKPLSVQKNGNDEYQFTMPAGNVTLSVLFGRTQMDTVHVTCALENVIQVILYATDGMEQNYSFFSNKLVQDIDVPPNTKIRGRTRAKTGYRLASVTSNGGCTISQVDEGASNMGSFEIAFTAQTASFSVVAEYAMWDISVSQTNAAVTVQKTAEYGTTVQFSAVADSGYTLTSVTARYGSSINVPVTSLGNGIYSFVMPNGDVTITAAATLSEVNCTVIFDNGVTSVTTSAGGGATWNASGVPVTIDGISSSATYTFNVALAQYYSLKNVTGTGCQVLSRSDTSFVIGFNSPTARISVVTEQGDVPSYPISYDYENATLTGAESSAEENATVQFSVLPANGYEVVSVSAASASGSIQVTKSDATYSFTMPAEAVTVTIVTTISAVNADVTVNFDDGVGYVFADVEGDVSWSATGASREVSYLPGKAYAFTAQLASNRAIAYVNGEDCNVSGIDVEDGTFSVTFTGSAPALTIGTRSLTPETVTIDLSVVFDAGVSSVSTGTTVWDTSGERLSFTAIDGEAQTFNVSLNPEYVLSSVSGAGCVISSKTENGFTAVFTTTSPSISVVTERAGKVSYPISYSYANGVLNAPSSAEEGDTVRFTFTPNEGYTIGSVTALGNASIPVSGANGSYSFVMPAAPVTVTITVNTPKIVTLDRLATFKRLQDAENADTFAPKDVVYAPSSLTSEQQTQARENIGAASDEALTAEETARADADTALGDRIDDILDGTTPVPGAGGTADRATADAEGNVLTLYYAHDLSLTLNPQTFVLTATLYAGDGSVLANVSVDLPLETMVVSGSYNEDSKTIVLTLQNGQTVDIPVGDLVDGLATQQALEAEAQARAAGDTALGARIDALTDGTTPVGAAKKLVADNAGVSAGGAGTPVYFESGVPVACGDELDVDVSGKAANADNLGGVPASSYALKSEVTSGVVYLDTLPEPTDTAPALVVVTGETNG